MTAVAAVRCAFPDHLHRQGELAEMASRLCGPETVRDALIGRLYANAGVETRHTVLPLHAYSSLTGLGATNDLYIDHATALGERAVRLALDAAHTHPADVDLLIATSVTGVAVPSLDARLISRLGLRPDVKRLPLFGLGRLAGAAGLARLHDYLLGWPGHTAVLLAVELCSLSIPFGRPGTADLVVSALFGDGAAALVARGSTVAAGAGPRILASRSEVCPDSLDTLGWRLGADGFRIVLSTGLSEIVAGRLGACVRDFLAVHGLRPEQIGAWICHPGGPHVIDAVQRSLGLPASALAASRRSLAEVGNLSSASVLHILQTTIAHDRPEPGTHGLVVGLGPGVSIELILLRW